MYLVLFMRGRHLAGIIAASFMAGVLFAKSRYYNRVVERVRANI